MQFLDSNLFPMGLTGAFFCLTPVEKFRGNCKMEVPLAKLLIKVIPTFNTWKQGQRDLPIMR
jgi:hypothetical protein